MGRGKQPDGSKCVIERQIKRTSKCTDGWTTFGRCGAVWNGLEWDRGKRIGWGSGHQGRLRIWRSRARWKGLGGIKKGHIITLDESKAVVVPDQGSNLTTS